MMNTLAEIREIYGDQAFALAQFTNLDHMIKPKIVTIKSNLTVWCDSACIINGMKGHNFIHDKDVKQVTTQLSDYIQSSIPSMNKKDITALITKPKVKKRL